LIIGRIIAIDFGIKRTGLAVTDPERIIASPLGVVPTEQLVPFLVDYINREKVDILVVGEPRDLRGRDTNSSNKVREFYRRLQNKFPAIPIHLVDERFTSKIAQDAMIRGGMKKKDRRNKGNIDKISATLILQSFLERRSG
jgi:putative holliday junction resolvase